MYFLLEIGGEALQPPRPTPPSLTRTKIFSIKIVSYVVVKIVRDSQAVAIHSTSYAKLSHGISWYIPRVTCIFLVYTQTFRRVCIPKKYKWLVGYSMHGMPWAEHNYFIPSHKKYSGQHNRCDIRAAHDGKVRCNTVEYTMVFLYSDWLYFLWHGTNKYIRIWYEWLSTSENNYVFWDF